MNYKPRNPKTPADRCLGCHAKEFKCNPLRCALYKAHKIEQNEFRLELRHPKPLYGILYKLLNETLDKHHHK